MKVKKVLILTTNYGDGHIKTADNLFRQIKDIDSSIEVKIVNLYNEAHPVINKIIKYTYLKCYSYVPKLYDFIYFLTKHPSRNFYYNNIEGLLGRGKLKDYLNNFKPDLVINTYSILAMPMLYKKGLTKVPCYTVVTDYGVHSQWIDPGVRKYFVGHERVKDEMIEWGVEKDKIEVSGIPVHLECSNEVESDKILDKYGIMSKNMPIVTVLGGANSVMLNLLKKSEQLYFIKPMAQFIIVCGRNKSLKEKLEKDLGKYSDRIKVLGFVDNLHEIMKASDIVISKPGGITVTEMLNLATPLVVFGSPAGQEKENTKFLLENECSYHAKNIKELIGILSHLIVETDALAKMKESAKKIRKPLSSSYIVNSIIKDFENKDELKETTVDNISDVVSVNCGNIS